MTTASDASTNDPLLGQVAADRYRILALIARGGMGRIYKAEQVGLGRLVALKVLDDRTVDPEGFRKRFTLEAATSAKLSHPNIVVIHDYGSFELDGHRRYFMAMELIDGPTLAALLKSEGGRIDIGRAAFIAREIARALRDAHKQGVVHRDLKPSNVMLVPRADGEQVKVLDFGIAKVMQHDDDAASGDQLTHEGVLVGTPRYMAPEQLTGEPIDARTDLYSLGVLLYQMIAGRTPHQAKNHMQAAVAHMQEPTPELPEDVIAEVPPALRDVIRTCLQRSPVDRFPDATTFLTALQSASAGLTAWGQHASAEIPVLRTSLTGEDPSGLALVGSRARVSAVTPPSLGVNEAATNVERADVTPPRQATVSTPSAPEPSSPEPRSPEPRSRAALVATIGALAALLFGGLALWLAQPPATMSEPTTSTPIAPPPTTPVVAVDEPPATTTTPPAPAPARFRLTITSTPIGASILVGDEIVGQTPTTLEIDADSVRAAPREYRLELDGHAPFTFTQGASERDVEVMATLAPLPERPVRPARPARPRTGAEQPPSIGPPEDRMLKTSR